MQKQFKKEGWFLFSDENCSVSIKRLAATKAHYLSSVCDTVGDIRGFKLDTYRADRLFEFEQAKSILRSLLRYDSDALLLANTIGHTIHNMLSSSGQAVYYTLPYPMIHFPQDDSEKGSLHCDGSSYIEEFYTTWTALNSCYGKPVSIVPGSHKNYRKAICRHLAKVQKFLPINGMRWPFRTFVSPDIELGQILVWRDDTEHIGNLNTTNEPTVAIVTRVTNRPMMYEPALSIKTPQIIDSSQPTHVNPHEITRRFLAIFDQLDAFSQELLRSPLPLSRLSEKVRAMIDGWSLDTQDREYLAFSLCLYAQRILVRQPCFLYDLCSILLADISFISLKRFLEYAAGYAPGTDLIDFIQTYMDSHASAQAEFVIKGFAQQHLDRLNGWLPPITGTAPMLMWPFPDRDAGNKGSASQARPAKRVA